MLIPSGYLLLREAVVRVAERLFPDAQVRSHLHGHELVPRASADAPEAARQAIEAAKQALWQAFADGVLQAFILTERGRRTKLPSQPWRTAEGARAMDQGRIKWRAAVGVTLPGWVLVAEDDVRRIWPESPSTHNIAQETELKKWLVEQMKAAPNAPRPKATMKKEAEDKFGREIGGREFDRVYNAAASEAETPAWTQAGRRPKSRH